MNDDEIVIGTVASCTITDKTVCRKCKDRFKCITERDLLLYVDVAINGKTYKVLYDKND